MLCDEWEMERDLPDVDNCLPGKCMMAHEDRSGSPAHSGRRALGLASVQLPRGFNQDLMSGKMRIVLKRSLIVVLIVLTGCVSESQSGIVARVEDWTLTETRLADLLVLAQPFPLDSAAVEDLVRHWVGAAAIAQVSSKENLSDGEEVVRFSTWLERDEAILQQEREERLGETVVVDSSVVERFFRDGSYRLLAHVLRRVGAETTQEERALQRRTAQRILDQLIAGGSWSVAVSESEDPDTRDAGGLLGLLVRGELPPELDRVAFQLQPGQVSGVTQTSRGFHILHRPRLEEVSDLYALHLRDRFLAEGEERSDQGLLVQRSWLVSSDAITSLRGIAGDPSAWLGTDLLLGSWQGGTLSGAMVARYVLALPSAMMVVVSILPRMNPPGFQIGFIGWDFNAQFADLLPSFMVWEGKLSLPWQMILYLTTGLLAFTVVSLNTRPMASEPLDRLFACLRTPIQAWEKETHAFTLPEGLPPAPRQPLIDHPDFEIPKPSLVGVLGFLLTWIAVGLLMASFLWILQPS